MASQQTMTTTIDERQLEVEDAIRDDWVRQSPTRHDRRRLEATVKTTQQVQRRIAAATEEDSTTETLRIR